MHWMKCSGKTVKPAKSRRAIAVALFVSSLGFVSAQETTVRSRTNLVLVPTLVKDARGNIAYGLRESDIAVKDDGVEQHIRLDDAPEGEPVSLVLAIQRGRRASYEFPRMHGLRTMLGPLFAPGTSRVAVVEFDSHVALTRNFTDDEALVDADLSNLQSGDNGAAILDAIAYSINLLRNEPEDRQRVLVLISETRDHGSHVKIEDAVTAVGQANALMYALAFSPGLSNILDTGRGTNKDEMHPGVNFLDLAYRTAQAMRKNVPATVTSMTGGEYELFASNKKFEARINDFTNHLHARYLLSFAPADPHAGLHAIEVRLKDPAKGTVLARTSYWAEGTAGN